MTEIFARFNPKWAAPEEGFCLSSFILATKGDSILLGKISDPDLWGSKWALPTWNPVRWKDKLLLPAAHMLRREHPDQAAERLIREMLNTSNFTLKLKGIQNHVNQAGHWDLCFVYEANIKDEIKTPPWFSELRYIKFNELKPDEIGRDHADIIEEAGIPIKR